MPDDKVDPKTDPETVTIPKAELDDIRNALKRQDDEIQSFRTRFNANADERPAEKTVVHEQAPVRTVTKEMIAEANQNGDYAKGAELSEKMAAEMANEVAYNFRKQHIEPANEMMLANFQESALSTISSKKHYGRFEKEIKKVLDQVQPQFRARKDVVKAVYDRVIGEHSEELEKEAAEVALRQAHEGGGGFTSEGAGRNAGSMKGGGMSLEEAYGEDGAKDVARILRSENMTIDQFYQAQKRRGLTKAKDTQEYLEQVKASREEGVSA